MRKSDETMEESKNHSIAKNDEEESEEEDEDYVPTKESDDEEDNTPTNTKSQNDDLTVQLSISKQKKVDEAFASLFGTPYSAYSKPVSIDMADEGSGENQEKAMTKSKLKKLRKRERKIYVARKKTLRRKKRFLTELFGKEYAMKILRTTSKSVSNLHQQSRPLIKMEKRTIIEVKKFAGKSIEVKKVVMVPASATIMTNNDTTTTTDTTAPTKPLSSTDTNTAEPPPSSSTNTGIDHVLSQIANPDKLSTMAKSSADWDFFKDRSGLEEELEKQAKGKNAYLVKKDFLQRVDLRKFEHEKQDRDKKRASAGK